MGVLPVKILRHYGAINACVAALENGVEHIRGRDDPTSRSRSRSNVSLTALGLSKDSRSALLETFYNVRRTQ
eukprot:114917-Pyramimonas_sp.AAC.1